MKKYEYKCIPIALLSVLSGKKAGEKIASILNEYGKQGWELVWVMTSFHYLRRELK